VKSIDNKRVQFTINYASRGRDSGIKISLLHKRIVRKNKINSPTKLANKLRELMKYLLDHEVDEMIYVRGQRIFDPHK
jgi:hemerythrin superfamily protein